MSRKQSILFSTALIVLLTGFRTLPAPAVAELPVLKVAQDRSYRALCLKLRRCRSKYTYCFNQIEKNPRRDQWSDMRTACVNRYKVCIKQNFRSGELFFERWLVPEVNCG